MDISSDPPARGTPSPMFGAKAAGAGRSGVTRHRRPLSGCLYAAPGRPGEIDPLDDETIELELTPDQLRTLEEAAKLAFARKPQAALQPTPRTPTATHQVNAPQAVAPSSAKAPSGSPSRRSAPERTVIMMPPVRRVTPARTATTVALTNSAGVIPLPVGGSAQRSILQSTTASATPAVSKVSATEAPRSELVRSHPSTTTTARWTVRRSLLALAIAISVLLFAFAAVVYFSASRPAMQPPRESLSTFAPLPTQPVLASTTTRPPLAPEPASSFERQALTRATSTQPTPAATNAAEPVTATPPVKFVNPFDRSEVFEFPPGTTRAEARDAVAQILMERARDRSHLSKPAAQARD